MPKTAVVAIETAENDWEREVAYVVRAAEDLRGFQNLGGLGSETRYLSPDHPEAATAEAVMVHVSINRPVGALLGESELATILPWTRRYSQMLEERVRLNWAARTFLWFVQVPPGRVGEKAAQYARPPEPGSIVIHDEGERWSMQTPSLHGLDAQHDLRALRQAIAAGSGQPPHWHGDGGNVNRAVAQAMQDPAVRRLRRRQRHLQQWVIELCHVAYGRAWELGMVTEPPDRAALRVDVPDISREDNESLALAAERLTAAFGRLLDGLPGYSPALARELLPLVFKFAGERLSPALAEQILDELGSDEA